MFNTVKMKHTANTWRQSSFVCDNFLKMWHISHMGDKLIGIHRNFSWTVCFITGFTVYGHHCEQLHTNDLPSITYHRWWRGRLLQVFLSRTSGRTEEGWTMIHSKHSLRYEWHEQKHRPQSENLKELKIMLSPWFVLILASEETQIGREVGCKVNVNSL